MIRSLFIRIETEEPRRLLKEEEAPELYALVREVARNVDTRPVDEIRLTPETELAVYERGSFKERMNDRAHGILVLGVGTLNSFDQRAFSAVLARKSRARRPKTTHIPARSSGFGLFIVSGSNAIGHGRARSGICSQTGLQSPAR